MKLKNCPYCGCELKETSLGRLWCSNCGIIDNYEYEEKGEETPSYIQ